MKVLLTKRGYEFFRCHSAYLSAKFKQKYCFRFYTFNRIRGRVIRTYNCENCFVNKTMRTSKFAIGRVKQASNIRDGYYCLLAKEERMES